MSGGDQDWQVGDLALCVFKGPWRTVFGTAVSGPAFGEIRLVTAVSTNNLFYRVCLSLDGYLKDQRFAAECFRKIDPHTPDAEDAETICLLNSAPARTPEPVS